MYNAYSFDEVWSVSRKSFLFYFMDPAIVVP